MYLFSDFENTVNANREAAERALIEVDRINEIIQQAKEKTDQAREAMTGADTSSQLALTVALEGEKKTLALSNFTRFFSN